MMVNLYAQNTPERYPDLTWDKPPVLLHVGKTEGIFSKEEVQFIASNTDIICLEKGHGIKQFGSTEKGIEKEVKQLKKANPDIKVIYYWNAFLDYPLYDAHKEYNQHPEWWLKDKEGNLDLKRGKMKRYDLSNSEVRKWWVNSLMKAMQQTNCDGVFMDAFPQVISQKNKEIWGEKKYDEIQEGLFSLIAETRAALGEDKLIIYNGIRWIKQLNTSIGEQYFDQADCAMMEHFGHFSSASKEAMLSDIQAMDRVTKKGKMVAFKAWPEFSWLDKETLKKPEKEKFAIAEKNITFPLACFLIGANNYSFFTYSWGYRAGHGILHPYAALQKKVGKPVSDYSKDGWVLTREYEFAKVRVDLEKKEAAIIYPN